MTSTIAARPGAVRRTRNRLAEHNLQPVRTAPSVLALDGQAGTLTRCADTGCDWLGWLPTADITTTQDTP